MKRTSVKRSKNKRKSETGKCLYKKSKVEKDPESENILPCSTPLQNKSVRDHVRKILAHTPSHLNVTASADQGSPVSAPTISQTSVKGNLTINQNFTVVLQNPSDGYPLPEDHSDVKEATYDDYQILPSHNTEQVPQKCESSHRRRHLSFKNCLEQHTLTLAEVKKDTNHLREVTVTGKILDFQPAISILQNEEGINYSHYILFKREGYCDSQQLEDHLLRAERMTIVCVDDEPRRVQIEAVEKAKDVANKSFFSRCCAM
ncbi:hypothetical protein G5714_009014 [Onychostoma macrolepis]|uniref:Uncharacterized protein n=1 Tax=Onychostoma macrolepis TaxID=369639 RepID=A0A7J6CVP2_9TELE|nr:hypothetical protein G5714_009014 [Onychostoma macrolepis]